MSVIKYKDSNGNYVKIPANVGINNVVEGYYNETDNEFYEESTYETEITGEANKIYISLDTDKSYYWNGSEYKLLSGGVSNFDDLTNRPQESDAIDIEDLDLPMPAKPTEYPILFDETGTEYKVGLYKRASDGKVKPVWRKDFGAYTTNINTGNGVTAPCNTDLNAVNPERIIKASLYITQSGGHSLSIPCGFWYDGTWQYSTGSSVFAFSNATTYFILEYTKTTDSWRDLP